MYIQRQFLSLTMMPLRLNVLSCILFKPYEEMLEMMINKMFDKIVKCKWIMEKGNIFLMQGNVQHLSENAFILRVLVKWG